MTVISDFILIGDMFKSFGGQSYQGIVCQWEAIGRKLNARLTAIRRHCKRQFRSIVDWVVAPLEWDSRRVC